MIPDRKCFHQSASCVVAAASARHWSSWTWAKMMPCCGGVVNSMWCQSFWSQILSSSGAVPLVHRVMIAYAYAFWWCCWVVLSVNLNLCSCASTTSLHCRQREECSHCWPWSLVFIGRHPCIILTVVPLLRYVIFLAMLDAIPVNVVKLRLCDVVSLFHIYSCNGLVWKCCTTCFHKLVATLQSPW